MRRKAKFFIFFLFAFGILIGCSKRPKGVLSEDEMVDVMVDMQIADAYYEMTSHGNSSYGQGKIEMGKAVLAKHGVTREELDSTLKWYGRNIDEYTSLFEKIDKELARQKKISEKENELADFTIDLNELWPYSQNGVISPNSYSNGWVFDLIAPEIEKGERVSFSMHFPLPNSFRSVIGVEYSDGSGESIMNTSTNKSKAEVVLQTDTGKKVERLYGSLILSGNLKNAIYADSISLQKLPMDSTEYRKIRSQKKYGAPRSIVKEKADSIKTEKDSINIDKELPVKKEPEDSSKQEDTKTIKKKKPMR